MKSLALGTLVAAFALVGCSGSSNGSSGSTGAAAAAGTLSGTAGTSGSGTTGSTGSTGTATGTTGTSGTTGCTITASGGPLANSVTQNCSGVGELISGAAQTSIQYESPSGSAYTFDLNWSVTGAPQQQTYDSTNSFSWTSSFADSAMTFSCTGDEGGQGSMSMDITSVSSMDLTSVTKYSLQGSGTLDLPCISMATFTDAGAISIAIQLN
jgi:hypothetical protein